MSAMLGEISGDVVARAEAGDRRARRHIADALTVPVFNLARRMLPSPADAEDATQEALVKVMTGLPSFRGQSKFSTWVWTVATRAIIDFRRGAFRGSLYPFEGFAADLADGLDASATAAIEDRVELGQVFIGCARALLMCLDGDHRLAYVLGEVMGFDGPTGAEICGIETAAFRKRLSRARAQIHRALATQCGVVNPEAPCRCHRRLARARALGRVGSGPEVDVARVRATVQALTELSDRAAAYYRADPGEAAPAGLLARVQAL